MTVNNSHFPVFSGHVDIRSLAVLVLLWCCIAPNSGVSGETVELEVGRSVYQVELADTSAQRRQGLMYRRQLGSRQGMLLVYPRAGDHRIWMKNMHIALRVFWIDAKFTVISVQRLEPCISTPCPVYSAPRAARFILELGDYDHDLAIGDKIEGLAGL